MKSPCYSVTLFLESCSDFQTFLKQYVILVPFGALIFFQAVTPHRVPFYDFKNYYVTLLNIGLNSVFNTQHV